jgi:hypothetical protein
VIAEVDFCEHEGHSLERLAVWIQTWNYTRTTLVLWEDHRIWVAMELLPTRNNRKYQISFNPEGDAFSAEELVEALRGTSSVSTRLCYGESPVATLRRIWRHAGEVEIKGTLDARKRTKR